MASKPETKAEPASEQRSDDSDSEDSLDEMDFVSDKVHEILQQKPLIAEELSKKWQEPVDIVKENLDVWEVGEFLSTSANAFQSNRYDGKNAKHLESLTKDFYDSKSSPNLEPLTSGAITRATAEVVLESVMKLLKREKEFVDFLIEIIGMIGLEYFPSSGGVVGAVTGLFRKVTGRSEWVMIGKGIDAVREFIRRIGAYLGEHGQWYGM